MSDILIPTTPMKSKYTAPRSPRSTLVGRVSTLAAVATATGAQAGIITNTSLGVSGFATNANNEGNVYWNIDNGGAFEGRIENHRSISRWSSTSSTGVWTYTWNETRIRNNANFFGVATHEDGLIAIAPGQLIGSANSFGGNIGLFSSGNMWGNFVSGESAYIGFRFNPDGTFLYGWAEVTLTEGGAFGTFQVHSWAYDDTGASIAAGHPSAIPEPASAATGLAALALGAATLRRKRRAAALTKA